MQDILNSIAKEWKQFLLNICIPLGIVWTVLEPVLYFRGEIIPQGKEYIKLWILGVLLLVGVGYAIYQAIPLSRIELTLSNRKVIIKFGNLFNETDFCKVIPVSSYFYETELEMPKSLQAQLIERVTKPIYLNILNKALKNITPINTNDRSYSNKNLNKKYALGTTIRLEASNNENYLLFPLTESEMKPMPSPNCDITRLWQALEKFWESASVEAKGESIAISLIGSNVNGINLHPLKTLEINLLAVLYALESRKLQLNDTQSLEIVIYEGNEIVKKAIDLKKVKQMWDTKHMD